MGARGYAIVGASCNGAGGKRQVSEAFGSRIAFSRQERAAYAAVVMPG